MRQLEKEAAAEGGNKGKCGKNETVGRGGNGCGTNNRNCAQNSSGSREGFGARVTWICSFGTNTVPVSTPLLSTLSTKRPEGVATSSSATLSAGRVFDTT